MIKTLHVDVPGNGEYTITHHDDWFGECWITGPTIIDEDNHRTTISLPAVVLLALAHESALTRMKSAVISALEGLQSGDVVAPASRSSPAAPTGALHHRSRADIELQAKACVGADEESSAALEVLLDIRDLLSTR